MRQSDDRLQVAVVTGASRGVSKGIALALGAAGMTVYVTCAWFLTAVIDH